MTDHEHIAARLEKASYDVTDPDLGVQMRTAAALVRKYDSYLPQAQQYALDAQRDLIARNAELAEARSYAENLEHELRRLRDVVGDEDAALIDAALAGNGNEIVPVRCACQETNGVLVCRAPAGAPGCRFDTVYNGNEKSRSENGAAKAVPSQSQSEVKP